MEFYDLLIFNCKWSDIEFCKKNIRFTIQSGVLIANSNTSNVSQNGQCVISKIAITHYSDKRSMIDFQVIQENNFSVFNNQAINILGQLCVLQS